MNAALDIPLLQVLAAYAFLLLLLGIVRRRGIRREREILIASARMTLQLILVGYVLQWVFTHPSPWTTLTIVAVMQVFAVRTVLGRYPGRLPRRLRRAVTVSIVAGTSSALAYFLFVVLRVAPWFEPRTFIPIAGMLIGNSMTGISLGLHALIEGMTTRRREVEEALALGATPRRAAKAVADHAFDTAILPTLNSMLGMGVVFLPGMMTGQILSGTAPTTAITYQIVIMLGIAGAVALSTVLMVRIGVGTYFNEAQQLVE